MLMRYTTGIVCLLSFMLATPAVQAEDLAKFMRAKLSHSEKILEGLAREDYDLIAQNSQAISLLCEEELWNVMQTPEYQERSKEFRRSVNSITAAAQKKNLEGAALAYIDATMKCVSCHSYIRSQTK
jgi:cytochrome c556